MKIKAKLANKTFFFLGDITLSKSGGETIIDLDGRDDNVLVALTRAVAQAVIVSDTDAKDILALVQNKDIKRQVALQSGWGKPDFESTETVKAEVVAMEVEEIPEVKAPGAEEVPEVEEVKARDLSSLLEGSARSAGNKIKKAGLTNEEKSRVLAAEKEGLNRSAVKKVLEV